MKFRFAVLTLLVSLTLSVTAQSPLLAVNGGTGPTVGICGKAVFKVAGGKTVSGLAKYEWTYYRAGQIFDSTAVEKNCVSGQPCDVPALTFSTTAVFDAVGKWQARLLVRQGSTVHSNEWTNAVVVTPKPPMASCKVNGSTASVINVCPGGPIRVDGSGSCAQKYFVAIQRSDAFWGLSGIEASRWLGVGYDVSGLKQQLVQELGIDRTRNVVIVGAGNLGMALADYTGFHTHGFHIVALLDVDPTKVGRTSRHGIPVLPHETLTNVVHKNHVEIGIIAVTADAAQSVHDALVAAGLRAILNFAPVQLRLHEGVKVKSVDLRINLESLSFHLKNVEDGITE